MLLQPTYQEECLDAIPASMAFDAEEIYRCIANHIGELDPIEIMCNF